MDILYLLFPVYSLSIMVREGIFITLIMQKFQFKFYIFINYLKISPNNMYILHND